MHIQLEESLIFPRIAPRPPRSNPVCLDYSCAIEKVSRRASKKKEKKYTQEKENTCVFKSKKRKRERNTKKNLKRDSEGDREGKQKREKEKEKEM